VAGIDIGGTNTRFAIIDKEGKIIDKFETEIPYKFMGNTNNIRLQDMKYPLSHVLSPLEGNKSMIEMGQEEAMSYYLLFSREKIERTISKIIDQL